MAKTEEKEQKKRRFGILYILLILLVLIFIAIYLRNTISQYTSAGTGTGTAQVAVWNVKFLKTNGTTEWNDTNDITFTPSSSANVVSGKIAPGISATGTGYIDFTGTETAVNFKIAPGDIEDALTAAGLSSLAGLDFSITSVTASNGDGAIVMTPNLTDGSYSGTVALPTGTAMTANEKVTFTVTITWNNDSDSGASDTAVGTSTAITASGIDLPVNVTVTQKQ
jgi:hypothetical protein